jgi:hypothetical protein
VVVLKKFSRKQLLHFTANLQVKLIGMEACGEVPLSSGEGQHLLATSSNGPRGRESWSGPIRSPSMRRSSIVSLTLLGYPF